MRRLVRHVDTATMRRRLIHTASSAAAKAAATRIAARQPKPTGAQVWYRPAVAVTLFDRVLGRWRGEPIDLNFDHATWASATTASRHPPTTYTTAKERTG